MTLKRYLLINSEYIGYYIIGFCLIFTGLYIATINKIGTESVLITIGIFIIAWSISRKSGKITNNIAKSSLYENLGLLNERRLGIRGRLELLKNKSKLTDTLDYKLFYSYSVWLCLTYLKRVDIFNKYFYETDENKIIHEIDCLFQDFCEGKLFQGINLIGQGNYIGNLEEMYEIISRYDRFNKDTVKDKFRREKIWTNLKYLKGLTNSPIFGF